MTQAETPNTALLRSLELYAECVGDPVPFSYQRFFAL